MSQKTVLIAGLDSTFGVAFSDEEWQTFSRVFHVRRSGNRETVWSPTQPGNTIFYVAEGLVRFYYLNDDATESDRLFAQGGAFVRPVTAVALGLPFGCQALAPSVVMTASYEALSRQLEASSAFRSFDERLSRSMLSMKDRHLRSLQVLSASERVQDFVQRFPDLVERVPQYHIANYLGMSAVSYSRLKGNS